MVFFFTFKLSAYLSQPPKKLKMEITAVILLTFVAIILAIGFLLFLANSFARPKHVGIGNGLHVPPVFSWINKPNPKWSKERRTVTLQNGSKYTIPIDMSGHFILLYEWEVKFTLDKKKFIFTIPADSSTDFASIPKLLQSLISPLSNTVYAAVVHDYFYRNPKAPAAKSISRLDADRIFYWSMLARGVWKITAITMYLGVRMFGGSSYQR